MKHYKPGQFVSINSCLFRVKKKTEGCNGCDLNNIVSCPMVTDRRYGSPKFNCAVDNFILKRV